MYKQNFVDYVKICCRSGKGGAGSKHFLRQKYVPRGGPDGGDGGRGGHIIIRGSRHKWTLLHLKYRKHVIAGDGVSGSGNNCSGAQGEDVILDVPLGTIVKDAESGEAVYEITKDGETHILTPGGRGGLGNTHFKSATRQTPDYAQPGEPGQEVWNIFELKVLADVGLVGFPNAGKSTIVAALSAAKPKIADYPFTTLVPQLGMVNYRNVHSFVIADIPGIIEGAHEGKGLGHRFLRHIERNATLLFTIPCLSENIRKEYQVLLNELERFKPELLHKPRLLAITKCDLIDQEIIEMLRAEEIPEGIDTVFISSVAQTGLDELKDELWKKMERNKGLE